MPKATKASMSEGKFVSTVHAPTKGRPSIAIISFAAPILPVARTMQDVATALD
jgi:hypothetical protein